jgi:hypothetical protein
MAMMGVDGEWGVTECVKELSVAAGVGEAGVEVSQ